MKSPRHWYIVKRAARKLGVELFKQDSSKFFPSLFTGSKNPVLSFCITHKNRLQHIQQTLPKNLKDNQNQSNKIEFVIVDFDVSNDLQNWIGTHFMEEIEAGYLRYFRAPMDKWSSPQAKNTAHMLGSGELLTNLDCDNYTGKNGGQFVIDKFQNESNEMMIWQFSRVRRDGSFGRITVNKKTFLELGGYDESLGEMGFQDNDFMNRAMAIGVKRIEINDRRYNQAIRHKKYVPVEGSFKELNKTNAEKSRNNLAAGKYRANEGSIGVKDGIVLMKPDGGLSGYE